MPRRYEVELTMGGLHEEDKNEDGFFEFSADTKIEFTYNTDSNFLVLSAGGIRGYEIVSTDLECNGAPVEHDFEHYTEKEMLIISNKVRTLMFLYDLPLIRMLNVVLTVHFVLPTNHTLPSLILVSMKARTRYITAVL